MVSRTGQNDRQLAHVFPHPFVKHMLNANLLFSKVEVSICIQVTYQVQIVVQYSVQRQLLVKKQQEKQQVLSKIH